MHYVIDQTYLDEEQFLEFSAFFCNNSSTVYMHWIVQIGSSIL